MDYSNTSYEDLEACDKVKYRLSHAVSATKLKFQNFNEFDKVYHQSGIEQQTNAQMHNPYSWSSVETITPRLVARKPKVLYSPLQSDSDLQQSQAKDQTALFNYWYAKDRVFSKLVSWVKGSQIYGTDHVKIYWKTETTNRKKYEYGDDGLPKVDSKSKKLAITTEESITFDDPTLENVSIYHLFVDPSATSLYDARWVIHRYYKTITELREAMENGKPIYQNLDELEGHIRSTIDSDSPEDSLRHQYAFLRRNRVDKSIDIVTILEMWDIEKGTMVTIAEGEFEIRPQQVFPFWHGRAPFVRLVDSLVPGEYYGKGEIEPVLNQQYALDTMDSLVIDNAIQQQQDMWKISGNIDESELQKRPNGVIHFNANLGESIDQIVTPDLIKPGLEVREQLKSDMQQGLGITDYTQGADSTVDRTATGTNIKAQSANARFAHKIQLFEEAIEEVGFQVMALYQQFMTEEKIVEVLDEMGKKTIKRLTPAQIAGEFNVTVEAGSSAPVDKDAQREDALTLYQLMQPIQDPQVQFQLTKELVQTFNFPDLLQSINQYFNSQQSGSPDPALAAAQQQHDQKMQQADQQHQMNLQQQAQQHQQELALAQQHHQETAQLAMQQMQATAQTKQAEVASRLEIEKMKLINSQVQKNQAPPAPHISEVLPFQYLPPESQDALLTSVGLPGGAVKQSSAEQKAAAKQPLVSSNLSK